MRKVFILTGPSGAGASTAKFVFEELGYYIIENFPAKLTNELFEKVLLTNSMQETVLITPVHKAKVLLDEAKKYTDFDIKLILLDCDKDELIRRYALSRHIHPKTITEKISLEKAIDLDLKETKDLIPYADIYVDGTKGSIKEFRTSLYNKVTEGNHEEITTIKFVSFGMKHGMQKDVDFVVDCRNIPNPFWVESLKEKTGLDPEVVEYLNSFEETKVFLEKTIDYLKYFFKEMVKTGRGYYTVGVACSGGHHRSTFIADRLATYFSKYYKTECYHRDCPELNKE